MPPGTPRTNRRDRTVDTGAHQGDRRRIGVVSFLNSRPLVEGLDEHPGLELLFDVPARLPALLEQQAVDAALVPVIDLARAGSRWSIVSDACIGSDGETWTVRVFSRVPAERITRLHVDGDSHTSVALARVLWQERHGRTPEIHRFQPWETDDCEAILLIGDKVVTHGAAGFAHEIDLGGAWKELTGLPFVFAVWARRAGHDVGELGALLSAARDRGVRRAAGVAARYGPPRGWSVAAAERYLTRHLSFTLTPRHQQGLSLFRELAAKWQILPPATEGVPA